MALIVSEFFGIIGVSQTPPSNMAELIPYILTIVVGLCLVSAVFRTIAKIGDWVLNFRRW